LWHELGQTTDQIQPYHFEIHYGKEAVRDAYYLRLLRQVSQSGQFTVASLHGFHDLFFHIPADPKRHTFIYAGQFRREPLDWQTIADNWRELTGQEPASANPDFLRFVRMALSLPIVPDEVLGGIQEFLELFAEFLTGCYSKLQEPLRLDRVRREVFVERWPNQDWVAQAVSAEKFHLTPWFLEGHLSEWMRDEMHICRLPTTALTLMPLNAPGEALDPVRAMIRNHRVQYECMKYAVTMPETGATKLEDYGVLFLTSADPKRSAARARLELRERGQELADLVKKRFGLQSVVGIGRTLPPGEPLYPSYHEAVMALHLCVQLDRNILFFDEKYDTQERLPYAELHEASVKLADAFNRVRLEEIKVAADQYVRMVLLYSSERIEVIRSQFLAMLFQLLKDLQRRHQIKRQAVEQFSSELTQKLENASSAYQVIESFKEILERLSFFSSQTLEGPKSMRLHETLAYLKTNFAEELKLPEVSRKAGFSVPAFSRIFKQATGTSFLSYLRGIRIEHAKMLLRTTTLSTEQIAQACGFQSQHHLIRSFKKVTRQTPGSYRREVSAKKSG
jgi:AraC-like DNA-binding protein